MQKVVLETKDNLKIVGNYYDLGHLKKGVLLLHMMPKTKESWWDFALILEDFGYQVLAIDLRGHGESSFGPDGYKNFKDEEHQKSILDVDKAVEFLLALEIKPEDIVLIGASIGANLVLKYLAEHPEIKIAVLLSPGLNYKEIKPLDFISNLAKDQKILIVSSKDDIRRDSKNSDDAQKIFEALPVLNKKLVIYEKASHGTDMFGKEQAEEPKLQELILNWIK